MITVLSKVMVTRTYRDHGTALLPGAARRRAWVLVALCVVVTAVLAVRYRDGTRAGRLDTAIDDRVRSAIGAHPTVLNLVTHLGDPLPVTVLAAILVAGCLAYRRWRAAALVAVAVPGASVLTKLLLQPWIHRTLTGGVSYPSGHATGAFALAVTVTVLLVDPPWPGLAPATRLVLAAAALVAASVVAVALVGLDFHYATDTVGGAALATAVVLSTALALDGLPTEREHPSP